MRLERGEEVVGVVGPEEGAEVECGAVGCFAVAGGAEAFSDRRRAQEGECFERRIVRSGAVFPWVWALPFVKMPR